jgi:predicted nuclease with RNAse H fold
VQRPLFHRFIGVDLGGGKGKKTALAVLERRPAQHGGGSNGNGAGPNGDDGGGVAVTALLPRPRQAPLYDTALVAALRERAEGALLCMDAPLTLPPCLRCQQPVCPSQERCEDPAVVAMRRLGGAADLGRDHRRGKPPVTPYTQRPTEVYLHRRRDILPRETLGQGMGPLTARAVHLMRALADVYRLDDNLIEVYPKATLALMGVQRETERSYKKDRDVRLRILSGLADLSFAPGVWREACVQSDHAFDAIICAYTGYLWARDGWRLPDDVGVVPARDGWIWVPPESEPVAGADTPEDPPVPRRQTLP